MRYSSDYDETEVTEIMFRLGSDNLWLKWQVAKQTNKENNKIENRSRKKKEQSCQSVTFITRQWNDMVKEAHYHAASFFRENNEWTKPN